LGLMLASHVRVLRCYSHQCANVQICEPEAKFTNDLRTCLGINLRTMFVNLAPDDHLQVGSFCEFVFLLCLDNAGEIRVVDLCDSDCRLGPCTL